MNNVVPPGNHAGSVPLTEVRHARAQALLQALPASVQLPAGTGKTHLLVDVVSEINIEQAGDMRHPKVLVLTHTNAGVQVIRRRLGTELARTTHVATITSFAFEFARAYPCLGGMTIPEHPDWTQSAAYLSAGVQVCNNRHVQQVLSASFSNLLVDEYQDCSQLQHQLVLNLQRAIPATAVFGDPLQAIFGFDPKSPLTGWSTVQRTFPDHPIDYVPWRWLDHNPELGHWLLELRRRLTPGSLLDLSNAATPSDVTFLDYTPGDHTLRKTLYRLLSTHGSVLVLSGSNRERTRMTTGRLGVPGYTAIEDINGTFMRQQLAELAGTPPADWASWTARFAKTCFSQFGTINDAVFKRLRKGQPTNELKRPHIVKALSALDELNNNPSLTAIAGAMHKIARAREGNLHSAEAWRDTATAISATANTISKGCSQTELRDELLSSLSTVRNRLRHTGSRERRQCVSRTVLAKGLEYDHVVIANLAEITDTCNLYVALTRARQSITIIGNATTGVAALHLGRTFLGIDLHPDHTAIAARRLTEAARTSREPRP